MDRQPRIVRESEPLNLETPLEALGGSRTETDDFYVRSHSSNPALDVASWRLVVDGEVEEPLRLALPDLQQFPLRTVTTVLECAGNGRTRMSRRAEGVAWGYGAAGFAEFAGIALRSLLERARLRPGTTGILFTAADEAQIEPGRAIAYARSLPVDEAMHENALLAWAMNGAALRREHGYPLRLVVPGWYGMASVKWLMRVTAIREPFDGYYQTQRYVYVEDPGTPDRTPVTRMRVRALISQPVDGARLASGAVEVSGQAWSGEAPMAQVEVSADGGQTWHAAELQPPVAPDAPCAWRFIWRPTAPGAYTLMARATDGAGHVQPVEPFWNVYGYGHNAVQRIRVVWR
jgi:DMSO/TMAO reductase YedYZ molybdopterin-dependent catalytic subunit